MEHRIYSCFRIKLLGLVGRWHDSGMVTFIGVIRIGQNLDGSQLSEDISWFVSNGQPGRQSEADGLFTAIGHHSGPPVRARGSNALSAGRYFARRCTQNG